MVVLAATVWLLDPKRDGVDWVRTCCCNTTRLRCVPRMAYIGNKHIWFHVCLVLQECKMLMTVDTRR